MCVKPIAKTESCQAAHLGYQLSGTMQLVTDSGDRYTIRAGEVFNIPAGHDGWVIGEEPVVVIDFQGMVEYAKGNPERPQGSGRKH